MADATQVSGLDEFLRASRGLTDHLKQQVMGQALYAGAAVLVEEIKRRVPVDSGALRDSIEVEGLDSAKGGAMQSATVIASDKQTKAARFIEFGTNKMSAKPFWRPAIAAKKAAATDVMTDTLVRGIMDKAA